jgi:NAD(P)-dependent dehydrogenase (short-subunit alcohol dehydrogenase family)
MYNPFSLSGKIILVTGASSGIGRATAIECSKMGAIVYILGRNKERLLVTFANLIPNEQNKFFIVDIASEIDISTLLLKIGSIDGIVNAAGIIKRAPFKFINSKDLNELINVNFTAPVLLIKQLVSLNKINNGGSIVFISSISGSHCSSVGNSMYSASKGALNSISKNMALELASKKIRVNTIHPGMVSTNMLNEKSFNLDDLKKDISNYPLKRYGVPEDVAFAVIYLLSNASTWVTGSNMLLDGGYTLK